MGEMLVVHRENDAFAVLVRDHVIHVDQPYGAGGMDIGPTPVELFVASLAARAAYYARRFLARRGLPGHRAGGHRRLRDGAGSPRPGVAHRSAAAASHPALRGDADGLLAAVEVCTVDNALLAPPNIGVRLETEARVA
ncbi:OsmC family protein [Actinomadura madurae]|uniref:OsmC family protein n=1 Tax=Actinomadura madurae TaxID=1993 RepID=UPI0020D24A2E|nr:OsmC family peroxiredoxin [Actinomadura madurae]MCQ0020696.1 OsmC family peroxiredoxin [Actinomadura madurae]